MVIPMPKQVGFDGDPVMHIRSLGSMADAVFDIIRSLGASSISTPEAIGHSESGDYMDVSITFPAVHVVAAAHIVFNNWRIEATDIEGALMGAAHAWSRCHDDELIVPWLIAAWGVFPEAAREAVRAGVILTDAR